VATPAITEPLRAVGETLDTELKRWLDLNDEKNGALFAKAALALRNNNGGRLIIGVDDRTNAGITFPNPLGDIRQAYHPDKLNEIVGKYALQKFEVRVDFKEYQGQLHPEIIIAGGITTPVLTRRGFADVLRQNAIYIRTISKGRVSSCEPVTAADWERLLSICFDNREAEIGRFVSRYLPAIVDELGLKPASPKPTSIDLAKEFLETGRKYLDASEGAPT